eukprot:COSAG05_NODE_2042_length_3648_cov_3.148774_6_plen_50_part_00
MLACVLQVLLVNVLHASEKESELLPLYQQRLAPPSLRRTCSRLTEFNLH